jgi:hypothetical protein
MKPRPVGAELFHVDKDIHDKAKSCFSKFCERAKKKHVSLLELIKLIFLLHTFLFLRFY